MTGHAYGDSLRWIAQSVHVLGVGLWLGTLAVIVIAPRRVWMGAAGGGVADWRAARERSLTAFAVLGGSSAAAVVASGVVISLRAFPTWSSLYASSYGASYLVKLALVGVVAALGVRNNRALRRAGGGIGRGAAAEVVVAALVLGATAVLTSLPPPGNGH
jgi:putative copper export protein